ncbi:MAG TPA: YfcC family protein [Candidatus Copromonas faecavium]|uniref:YfcC family protein n=1 Tax=Candidatus Copromonas faecavium (nom. illeg.) TaxID=2840740 RepID=A0A9D1A362_9FIRM|nr:YfcC family protein [Candidatus Copromonas faecavium]
MNGEKKSIGERILNQIPHPLAILVIFVLLGAAASYILPAGNFNRVTDETTGITMVETGSYHTTERTPVNLVEAIQCLPEGCVGSASIIFFVLLMGGGFGILEETGAMRAGINQVLKKYREKRILIVIAMTVLLSLCASTFGMSAEMLAFTPILVTMAVGLGYDALVGVAIPILAMASGYAGAAIGPYTVRIGQEMAQLPPLSGIAYRIVFWCVVLAAALLYLISYCNRIYQDPSKSLVGDTFQIEKKSDDDFGGITKIQAVILCVFAASIVLLVAGCIQWQISFNTMAALFVGMGILSGLLARMSLNEICDNFIKGARGMMFAALAIGFANGIMIVLTKGNILDTVINGLVAALQGTNLPAAAVAVILLPVLFVISLFIPSGSGQAAAVMPILIPIADLLGINRQIIIFIFQIGQGLSCAIVPTLGLLMANLAIGKIPYGIWFKFVYKLFLALAVIGMVFIAVAVKINYGPF